MWLYLLPGVDVYVDVFEHWLQRGVISDAQILDLDLSLSGPAVRDLRLSWDRRTHQLPPGDLLAHN